MEQLTDESSKFWAKAATWEIETAVALFLGYNPPNELDDNWEANEYELAHLSSPVICELLHVHGIENKKLSRNVDDRTREMSVRNTPAEWLILFEYAEIPVYSGMKQAIISRVRKAAKIENSGIEAITQSENPISTTERNSLLTIIAALCDYSAIKHQERGAATQISKMTEEIGAAVSYDTVRRALAKIPDALESRMK